MLKDKEKYKIDLTKLLSEEEIQQQKEHEEKVKKLKQSFTSQF